MTKLANGLIMAVAAGLVVGLLRVSYLFFPGFLLTDVVLFGLLGAWIAHRWTQRWCLWTAVAVLPSVVLAASMLDVPGGRSLVQAARASQGFSIALIPLQRILGRRTDHLERAEARDRGDPAEVERRSGRVVEVTSGELLSLNERSA